MARREQAHAISLLLDDIHYPCFVHERPRIRVVKRRLLTVLHTELFCPNEISQRMIADSFTSGCSLSSFSEIGSSVEFSMKLKLQLRARGFEFVTFDVSLLPIIWKKQSSNWEALALGYVEDITSACLHYKAVIEDLQASRACQGSLAKRLYSVPRLSQLHSFCKELLPTMKLTILEVNATSSASELFSIAKVWSSMTYSCEFFTTLTLFARHLLARFVDLSIYIS